jgi:hypothetical protein
MTNKELLELLQGLDETQLNKQLTIYIPEGMPSGFTTDVWDAFCCERWSSDIESNTPYLNIIKF